MKIVIKILHSYQIITSFVSYKILTPSFNQQIAYIKKRAKFIATYGFSTLYIKLPHDKLKFKLSSIVDFTFKGEDKTFIRLSNIDAVNKMKTKTKGDLVFVKLRLKQL